MATYNGEKFIREQLESIVPYMNANDELIVSDDGSSDATKLILGEFIKTRVNIRCIDGPKNGVVKNFENAIKAASKDILMFADQDDVWLPEKLSRIRELFESQKNVELVLHDMYMCSNEQIEKKQYGQSDFSQRKRKHGILYNMLYSGYYGCCMCFRKELKDEILPFSDKVNMYDQWIGLIGEYRKSSVFLNEPLIIHRVHGNNMTQRLPLFESIKYKKKIIVAFMDYLKRKRK